MTLEEFRATLSHSTVPQVDPLLQSLWFDAKGDWNSAHDLAQDVHTQNGAWMHAYLHRKEGDQSNAAYWYARASKTVCRKSLDDEWTDLVTAFLK